MSKSQIIGLVGGLLGAVIGLLGALIGMDCGPCVVRVATEKSIVLKWLNQMHGTYGIDATFFRNLCKSRLGNFNSENKWHSLGF